MLKKLIITQLLPIVAVPVAAFVGYKMLLSDRGTKALKAAPKKIFQAQFKAQARYNPLVKAVGLTPQNIVKPRAAAAAVTSTVFKPAASKAKSAVSSVSRVYQKAPSPIRKVAKFSPPSVGLKAARKLFG